MAIKGTSFVATVILMLCGLVAVTNAQDREGKIEGESRRGNVSSDTGATPDRGISADRRNQASQGMAHRASEIQGMTVKNDADKELATVKDIVIDVRGGQVKYAALSYGGLLGLGDKLFAVPWNAFKHRHDPNNDVHTLVLSIDEATLKNAPGFDESKWPNFANASFNDEIEKHYGKRHKANADRAGDRDRVDVEVGPVAVDVDAPQNRDRVDSNRTDRSTAPAKDVVYRASDITGMTVRNAAGKELGSVNDLVIDMNTGVVRYAALSYGGFLGLGDKLFAVPWDAFECQYDKSNEKYDLILSIAEATLRNAPGFDQDNWPNLGDAKFADDIDEYYRPARRQTDSAGRIPRSAKSTGRIE